MFDHIEKRSRMLRPRLHGRRAQGLRAWAAARESGAKGREQDEKGWNMARITVDEGFCKGCGLCVDACPVHIVELDRTRMTPKGYHPAHCVEPEKCTGCTSCALMCPDVAITVER